MRISENLVLRLLNVSFCNFYSLEMGTRCLLSTHGQYSKVLLGPGASASRVLVSPAHLPFSPHALPWVQEADPWAEDLAITFQSLPAAFPSLSRLVSSKQREYFGDFQPGPDGRDSQPGGPLTSPAELSHAGPGADVGQFRDRSCLCISEARPHFSQTWPFPQLFDLIKGGQKITYTPKLQQQRLGFSFRSKQQGCLIQMLIAGD